MAVTESLPKLNRLALACRQLLNPPQAAITTAKPKPKPRKTGTLIQAFSLSALVLPGMVAAQAMPPGEVHSYHTATEHSDQEEAADDTQVWHEGDDEVGFQYSHYEEAKRDFWAGNLQTDNNGNNTTTIQKYPLNLNPVTVDSQHAYTKLHLTDRVRFNFNYAQDVWSGATPLADQIASGGEYFAPVSASHSPVVSGATYEAYDLNAGYFFDKHNNPLYNPLVNYNTGSNTVAPARYQHILAYASPEIRNQIDFKLGYDWDNAALDVGGGASIEHDYLARFGNIAGRFDFDQKRTSLNYGFSYTNSDVHSICDTNTCALTGTNLNGNAVFDPAATVSSLPPFMLMSSGSSGQALPMGGANSVKGNRDDTSINLGLSHILSKNAVLSGGFSYNFSHGLLSNPYKDVMIYLTDPNWFTDGHCPLTNSSGVCTVNPNLQFAQNADLVMEKRPNQRNQFTWDLAYRHYIEPVNAAAKLSYSFFHDDWGINAHTFAGEWRQSLGSSWTLTPHARYYSQTAADFYTPALLISDPNRYVTGTTSDSTINTLSKSYYSSDQRLSAYGAVSGGVTLSKQFAKGLMLELGYEYYVHKGALAMDGQGTADYADYRYFMANATLRANLGLLAQSHGYDGYGFTDWLDDLFTGSENPHAGHMQHHHKLPAGIMFGHALDQAGDYMLGYRYQRSMEGAGYLHNTQPASYVTATNFGGGGGVPMISTGMQMNMHMLDIMYAPTDWLTLMLMPQYMTMDMNMAMVVPQSMVNLCGGMVCPNMRSYNASGGIGDTGGYLLFKLWDSQDHKLVLSQGATAPTGNIHVRGEFNMSVPYAINMQLGSGTWDYKPALTYSGRYDDFFWGAQAAGTYRMRFYNQQNLLLNDAGYRLGDIIQGSLWAGYQATDWLSATLRGVYTGQGKTISFGANNTSSNAADPLASSMYTPETYITNNGGMYGDVGFGLVGNLPFKPFAGHTFSFEWLQPVYTNVVGYQHERTGQLNATWNMHF